MVNCDSGPSVLELLLNPGLSELADELLLPVLVVTVAEKLLDIQDSVQNALAVKMIGLLARYR